MTGYSSTILVPIELPTPVSEFICFGDALDVSLTGFDCNAARLAIREGFVDKAAGISQLVCDLTYGAPLRMQAGNPQSIHGCTRPAKRLPFWRVNC
jgi:hypothetical protein